MKTLLLVVGLLGVVAQGVQGINVAKGPPISGAASLLSDDRPTRPIGG